MSSPQVFATVFYASLPRRNIWCSAIFAGAAFTDWLDGYIARRQGIVTPFGSFLDPVADKVRQNDVVGGFVQCANMRRLVLA